MVLGNFALLASLHPDAVNEWHLSVFADAYEWLGLPNVSGMVLFAEGGLLASKSYASGGPSQQNVVLLLVVSRKAVTKSSLGMIYQTLVKMTY